VVHEVGRAGNRGGRERQRVEELRVGAGRRGDRDAVILVDVVREADRDAAGRSGGQRALDDRRERVRQPKVVDRDVERVLRGAEPVGERVGRLLRRLAAVGEGAKLYAFAFARIAALCARFAA
jgi:hypothetical protein